MFLFSALVAACGGDGDSSPPIQQAHQPFISNLRYTPTSALQSTSGTITIVGTFDFKDAGGDVAVLHMTSSGGGDTSTATPQFAGIVGGTATGQAVVAVDKVGTYTFELWVTDSMGKDSNRLSGTFEVIAPPQPPRPSDTPGIVGLRYSPSFAYQSAGGTIAIRTVFDFVDTGGDIVALRAEGSWGAGETVAMPDLRGMTSGTTNGPVLAVPLGTAGTYTFEVWAVDGKGAVSNRLSGTFEVLATAVPAAHSPVIRNLQYSPKSSYQRVNGTALIRTTVEFSDPAGDVVALRLVSSGGADLTAQAPELNGVVTGQASADFVLPIDRVGKQTFEIWALDSRGSSSNRLSGTYEVLAPDTWVKLPVAPPAVLNAIAWNGRYVAVGSGGTVMTSVDLNAWTAQSIPQASELRSVAASSSRFVTVGENSSGQAVVLVSSDGWTWAAAYRSPAASMLSKVIWAGSQFVAVGNERGVDGKLYALILTSSDGLNWTQQSIRSIEVGDFGIRPRGMTSVAWSGSLFVATGLDTDWSPAVWRSTDALTWIGPVVVPDAIWAFVMSDITWGNGRFVAVNSLTASTGDSPVHVSTDGVNWLPDNVQGNLPEMNAITVGEGGYLAVGPAHRQTSADGLTWTTYPMTDCGNGLVWDGTRYVAVGQAVCKSP